MKRPFLVLGFFIISLLGLCQKTPSNIVSILQTGNSITVTFNLPDYVIKDTSLLNPYGISELYKYIDICHFGSIDDIGYPKLPQLTIDLAIPSGASDFVVSTSNVTTQLVTLNRKFLPTQEDFEENPNFQINSNYYNSTGGLYNFIYQLSEPFIVFDAKGISLSIFPFTYNPVMNRLTIVKQTTFTITYSLSTPKEGGISYTSRARENYLLNFFDNYNETKSESDFEGRYLIITAPAYENSLINFANYKRNIGFEVNLASTNTTGTSASDIKTYLQNQYNSATTRPDFVLLVGDHEDIPASGGNSSGEDKNDPITDLNYARLAGDDYFADVFIGRFSVSNTNQLQNIIRKTTHMEMNMHLLDKTAKFLAGSESNGWMESQFEKGHDHVIKNTFNPQGYNSQKLYQPTTAAAVSALSDNPLYYIYSGHGSFTYLAGGTFSLYNSDLTSATNTVFPFGFSFACITGNYAYSLTCFGEHWIRSHRGGVTYFGSSVNTYVNSDKAIEKKIFGDAFIDKDHIATITNLGMKRYWQRFWSWSNRTRTKRYMKAYNLLGDPSLNKNGVRVLSIPVICGPTTIKVKNPHLIPVSWSATGDYSLSSQTDTSVVVTPTGINTGAITVVFLGLASISENLTTCNLSISGPTTVCNTNTTFTLNNMPAGYTVSWTRSSNLAYVSGQGTGTYRVKAASSTTSGPGWVQAVVSGPCGDLPPLRCSVSVGPPARPHIRSGSSTQTGGSASYTLSLGEVTTSLQLFFEDPPGTASATGWEVVKTGSPQNFDLSQSGNTVLVTPLQVGTGQFTVRSYNACGESTLARVYLTIERLGGGIIDPPGWPIELSPNPARGEVLRSASANGTQLAAGDAPVVVTSATGQPVFRGTLRNGALRLNVSGWQRGVYQVVVVHQGQRHAASLVVE